MVFSIAGGFGRRISAINIIALAATVLLIWRPEELFEAGFQLSFGIVAALVAFTLPMRRRLFGEPHDIEMLSAPEMFVEWMKTFVSATLVAWVISIPLVAQHFSTISLIAPVATLVASPLVFVILAAGYVKTLTSTFLPSIGVILGPVLTISTDALIGLVSRLEALPAATLNVDPPGLLVTAVSTAVMVGWIAKAPARLTRARYGRIYFAGVPAVLIVLLACSPGRFLRDIFADDSTGRITMFSVGNGSCYLVRTGDEAFLFDAGSGNYLGVGDSVLVPSLRKLGVFDVSTIIISHGDVDHFAAAIEIINEFNTKRLIVTPQFAREAEHDPFGPESYLLQHAERAGVSTESADVGDTRTIGRATLEWLHPDEDDAYDRVNDASAVVRVTIGRRRILFTGDIQSDGIATLVRRFGEDQLRADILELPHHGGWSDEAVAFVNLVDPQIVLQSTGFARLRNDRWQEALSARRRFVSAWCGETTCILNNKSEGEIEVRTFLKPDQ